MTFSHVAVALNASWYDRWAAADDMLELAATEATE